VAKAAGKSPNSSAKRPRPKSPATATPSSAKRRMEPATVTEAEKLVLMVLNKCHRDVWWRITPDSYGEDDISVGSRQEWVDLLPVLIEAGMLRAKYSANDGQYQLVYSDASWRNMQHLLEKHHGMALHLSCFQPKGRRKAYYFCVKQKYAGNTEEEKKKNRLQFTGPSGQKAFEKKNGKIAFSKNARRSDKGLSDLLIEYRKQLHSANIDEAWNKMVDAVKNHGLVEKEVLATLKETGMAIGAANITDVEDAANVEDASNKADDDANGSGTCSVHVSRKFEEQVEAALNLNFDIRMANDPTLRPPRPNAKASRRRVARTLKFWLQKVAPRFGPAGIQSR